MAARCCRTTRSDLNTQSSTEPDSSALPPSRGTRFRSAKGVDNAQCHHCTSCRLHDPASVNGAAFAQEACKTYTVKAGDNLRNIARAAYGDPDLYRVIYNANAAVIGAKADLIEIGMALTIPCDTAEPALAVAEEIAAPAATTASAAAPPVQPDVQPIGLVTGNDLAPFTDQVLPGGGMITQLVEMAIFRADPQMPYTLTFIDDWQAHIDALLPAKAYDLSFPWTRPDCEAAGTLSASDLNRCENYVFSAPFFETVDGFFVKTGSDLSLATHYEAFAGKKICRPEGYSTNAMDEVGLSAPAIELVRPALVEGCFAALLAGKVDLVAIDADVATSAIVRLGLTADVEQNPFLSTVESLHVIAHKSNERAVATIGMLNEGITEMSESGEWYDVVSTALATARLQQ